MSPHEILDLCFRSLFGLNFFVFGLNGFFHWFALPPTEEPMREFIEALGKTNYLMTVIKSLEVAIGICLLTNRFVPLAIATSAPLAFGIVSSQLLLNKRRGWGISALTLVPFVFLVHARQDAFASLFSIQ